MKPGFERNAVMGIGAATLATVLVHPTAMVLAAASPLAPVWPAAYVGIATAATAMLAALLPSGTSGRRYGIVVLFAAPAVLAWTQGAVGVEAMAIPLTCAATTAIAAYGSRRLPAQWNGLMRRRPGVTALWAVLGLAMVVQVGRLSTYIADPAFDYTVTTSHPLWAGHACMNAYLFAAELNQRGEANVYDVDHYPGTNPDCEAHTNVAGMTPEDPYQYPPQFLLLPRAALAMSSDYQTIRQVWFAMQSLDFLLVALLVARWMGGTTGWRTAMLVPLALISIPTLYNFQYGQFHLSAVVCGLGAMLAFDARRDALGGGLLATAILAKMFPVVLIVPLLVQRRWRALGWTAGWAAGITLVGLLVLGTAPYRAFFEYQLPRLLNGSAFAFENAWPEMHNLLVVANISIGALFKKLALLGLPVDSLAGPMQYAYYALVFAVAVLAGRRGASRSEKAVAWLALLNLAALASPGAWSDYVAAPSMWLVTLLAARSSGKVRHVALLTTSGAFAFFVPGAVPYGKPGTGAVAASLSILSTLVLLGLNAWVLLRGWRLADVAERFGRPSADAEAAPAI